jgi:peptide/nickel transport system substrate-binding protein
MKKAGMLDHTFNLHAADAAFAGAVDAAVLMKEQAKKAGININVVREPDDGYWSNVWMKKEWCMCYWGGRPIEDMMFSVAYSDGAPWNDTHWKNDRFNELLVSARAELDTDKRRRCTRRCRKYAEMTAELLFPCSTRWLKPVRISWPMDLYQGTWLWMACEMANAGGSNNRGKKRGAGPSGIGRFCFLSLDSVYSALNPQRCKYGVNVDSVFNLK